MRPSFPFFIIIVLCLISCNPENQGKNAFVDLQVQKDTVTIGDLVPINLEVYDPEKRPVVMLGAESGEHWEFRNISESPGTRGKKYLNLNLVFWDTGRYTIPPLSVGFINATGDTTFIDTDSSTVLVQSVLKPDDQEMKPIKGPVPLKWKISRQVFLLLTLVILAGILAWILIKKRVRIKEGPIFNQQEPVIIDPVQHALDRLNNLKESHLSDLRENYFTLTHILREFLESIFFVRTLEMTTGEIISHRHLLNRINDNDFSAIKELLSMADQIKFARQESDLVQWEKDIGFAGKFINQFNKSAQKDEQGN